MNEQENYNINVNNIVTINDTYELSLLKFKVTRSFNNLCNIEITIDDDHKYDQLTLINYLINNDIRWTKTKEFIYKDKNSKFIVYNIPFDILTKVN